MASGRQKRLDSETGCVREGGRTSGRRRGDGELKKKPNVVNIYSFPSTVGWFELFFGSELGHGAGSRGPAENADLRRLANRLDGPESAKS